MDEMTEWSGWTDGALIEYEQRLYDRAIEGEDTWLERDQLLWEISRRGLGGTGEKMIEEIERPVEVGAAAYIMVEAKTIWFWQRARYSWRAGWTVREDGWLRLTVERCIG